MTAPKSDLHVLDRLAATVVSRRGADPAESYTAKLLSRGIAKAAQKLGEEAVETVIEAIRLETAAEGADRSKLAAESADLLYHLTVVWAAAGLDPNEVWEHLSRREGTSGIAEKAARPDTDR